VDLEQGRAAANLDSHCTGTSLRDFIRGSDRSQMPDEVVARYDDDSARDGVLVFQPA
jgi:hypothetical protein